MKAKTIRQIAAGLFFAGITLLLSGINHHLAGWLGWMADLQFLPALLALNLAVVAALVLLTLLFGRIYCSLICPLGIFQDILARIVAKRRKRSAGFRKELKWLRYPLWVLYVAALLAGFQVFVAILAPYSTWGRIVGSIFSPSSWGVVAIAAGGFVVVGSLAVLGGLGIIGGRSWCNAVCPVGTTLSFFSRFALFRPVIDASKCRECRQCERLCRASCIDIASKSIDYSRCVDCFDCLDDCRFGALSYRFAYSRKNPSSEAPATSNAQSSRRAFLLASAFAAGSVLRAQTPKLDGGKAPIVPKKEPRRRAPITPPGSQSAENLYSKCTACQLCISNCPNGVLRPSLDPEHFMQPYSSYEKGWCRPECTSCGELCPTGAILPLTREQKTAVSVGRAVWHRHHCLPVRDGVSCGNCASHCPSGAIVMVPLNPDDKSSLKIPSVLEDRCTGCGACEYLCPVRPISAIRVEANTKHILR